MLHGARDDGRATTCAPCAAPGSLARRAWPWPTTHRIL